MGMSLAALITHLHLTPLALSICLLVVPALGHNLLSCKTTSPDASGYHCISNGSRDECGTFAVLRASSYFSSLSNLSFYLGLNRFAVAEANGFSAYADLIPADQPLLIPIDCKCTGGLFRAQVTKTAIKGESFYGIAESLQGLTTCKAIRELNLGISPWYLRDKVRLQVPLRCACPFVFPDNSTTRLLLTYPVSEGDTISNLAFRFNTTPEAIISANDRSLETFKPDSLEPLTSVLIPLNGVPAIAPLTGPHKPNLHIPASSIPPVINPHKKKSKMWRMGVYIAVIGAVIVASIAVAAAYWVMKLKQQQNSSKEGDMELQQLSLSVGTTSEKKVSFEGSQDPLDGHTVETTPRLKVLVETYTVEEMRKATEDFDSTNLIDGSVYHGRLNGKSLAIKRVQPKTVSQIDLELFHNAALRVPNTMRLLGVCSCEGPESFLVFEYAKNGSLKDWLHGGLAMKSQFIASCYCFLRWNQRLKICLDVAVALQYMHHIMNPSYVHRNVKSRNIFLDEDFNAKIANFGMARCVQDDAKDSEIHSTCPASWNLGYLAPEYINEGTITPSIDVFAFGVVLLEVLSGQTPITRPNEKGEESIWLSKKIKSIVLSENAEELRDWMDSSLGENYSFDAAVTLANLARACVEEDPSLRPTAGEIVEKLLRLVEQTPEGDDHMLLCECSAKPLVKAAATSL